MRVSEVDVEDTCADGELAERNRLVVEHVGLVKALASRLAQRVPAQVEVNELVGAGMIGLIDAAGRYRPALGVPFDAFARRRVHGAMLDSLRGLDWAPRSVRRMRRDVDATINRLRHELAREPEAAEIAAALNVTEAAYDRMLDQIRAVDIGTLRQLNAGTSESPMLEVAIDPGEGQEVLLERAELKAHLARAICELPNASARFSRSTTRKSSRWRKSARSSASASRGCRSCAPRPSHACAAASARRSRRGCDEQDSVSGRD
jgi:RNA polymerase sigma factor for flagellar operon FliA